MADQRPPLRLGEVARLFNVSTKTVTRWANLGRIECFRTPLGHRRFPADAVDEVLARERARRRP